MKLLDLYSGAGGTAMGLHRAGFTEIVGVDIENQPRYPFEFVQADALEYALQHGHEFDLVTAAPPCQGYTRLWAIHKNNYPKLIPATRTVLKSIGRPYVIENVYDARFELDNPIMLCGTMFGLRTQRHRVFECTPVIWWPPRPCQHIGRASAANSKGYNKDANGKRIKPTLENFEYITVAGHDYSVSDGKIAMGINWMTGEELSQAIPPAYTEWLGRKLILLIKEQKL